jgi:hypothetical protein
MRIGLGYPLFFDQCGLSKLTVDDDKTIIKRDCTAISSPLIEDLPVRMFQLFCSSAVKGRDLR